MIKNKFLFNGLMTYVVSNVILSCSNPTAITKVTSDSNTIVCTDGESGGYLLVGEKHLGSYKDMRTPFDSIKTNAFNIIGSDAISVAVYFDDDAKVIEEKLEGFIGFIVKDSTQANEIIAKYPKYTTHFVEKKSSYWHEENFTNWNSYLERFSIVYDELFKHLMEKHGHMTEKESAIEEYNKEHIKYILRYELD